MQNYYEGIDYSSFSSVVFFTDSSLFSTKSFNYRRKELDVVRLTENESLYNELPIHEIILKDRLLRNLDYDEAVDLIKVTFCFWCGLIEDQKPDYLITQAVDNYILHLADLVCLYKSVVFVGLVPAPFDLGTMLTRQSTRVHHAFRKDWTVEDIRTKITTQNEVVGYKNRGVKRKSLLSRLKDQMTFNLKILLFPLLVLMDKERHDAYHWRVTRYSYRSYWRNASSAIYFDNKEVNPDKKTVLIPLNCAPEMAFDYWIDDIRVNDYQNFLLEMVTELNKKFNVIIKEHPHAHYTRVQSFFSSLSEYAKIDVSKKTVSEIITQYKPDLVYSGNSSFAIECLVKGTPVLWYSKIAYCEGIKLYSTPTDLYENFNRMKKQDLELDSMKILSWLSANTTSGGFWEKTIKFEFEENL